MSVTIKRFNPAAAQVNRAYLIIGKKGSGKSTVMFTLLSELCNRIDYATAMCGTRDGIEKLNRVLPSEVIYTEFNQAAFCRIVNTLNIISRKPGYEKITAVVLDDLAYGKSAFKSDEMRMALMNGRWLGLMLILTQQYLMDIGPDLRGNFDYIFAMAETAKKTRQKLYDLYFGVFNSFNDFDRVFTQVTSKKGRALVLDTTSSSNNVQDRVFYYDGNIQCTDFVLGKNRFRSNLIREISRSPGNSQARDNEDCNERLVL